MSEVHGLHYCTRCGRFSDGVGGRNLRRTCPGWATHKRARNLRRMTGHPPRPPHGRNQWPDGTRVDPLQRCRRRRCTAGTAPILPCKRRRQTSHPRIRRSAELRDPHQAVLHPVPVPLADQAQDTAASSSSAAQGVEPPEAPTRCGHRCAHGDPQAGGDMDELPPEEARPEPNLLPARDNLQPRGRAAAAARITALCERIKERTKERRQGGDAAVPQHTAHSGDHPGQHGGANSDNSGTDHARRGVAATTHPGGGEQLARRGTGPPTRPRGGHSAKRRTALPTRARHSRSGGSLDSKAIQQLLASEGGNIARRGTASPTRPRGTGPHARRGAAIPTRELPPGEQCQAGAIATSVMPHHQPAEVSRGRKRKARTHETAGATAATKEPGTIHAQANDLVSGPSAAAHLSHQPISPRSEISLSEHEPQSPWQGIHLGKYGSQTAERIAALRKRVQAREQEGVRRGTAVPTRPRGGAHARRGTAIPTRAPHSHSHPGGYLSRTTVQKLLTPAREEHARRGTAIPTRPRGESHARRGTATPTRPRGDEPHARRGAAITTRLRQAGELGDWRAERLSGACASPDIRHMSLVLRSANYGGPQAVDAGSESQPPCSRADVMSASKESESASKSGPTIPESNPKQSSAGAALKVEGRALSNWARNGDSGRAAYGHGGSVEPLHGAGL